MTSAAVVIGALKVKEKNSGVVLRGFLVRRNPLKMSLKAEQILFLKELTPVEKEIKNDIC